MLRLLLYTYDLLQFVQLTSAALTSEVVSGMFAAYSYTLLLSL